MSFQDRLREVTEELLADVPDEVRPALVEWSLSTDHPATFDRLPERAKRYAVRFDSLTGELLGANG
jgi:hypothetical protein